MVRALHHNCPAPFIRRSSIFFAFQIGLVSALSGQSSFARVEPVPEYQIGDRAREDVSSPTRLVVIDPEETAALKEKEALKVQVICRYNTNVIETVEQEFHAAFATTRSNFLNALEGFYGQRELGGSQITAPKFHRLMVSFQRANKAFPLTTNLARLWARGESDGVIESSFAARVREAMSQRLRRPELPPGMPLSYNLRMVPVGDWNEEVSVGDAEKRGKLWPRTNLVIVGRARSALRELFSPEEPQVGKFLAGLLRTNCVVDEELTRQARAKRVEALWAADHYEAGQLIVQRGELIDKKIKAALEQLREKTAAGSLEQLIVDNQVHAEQRKVRNRWIAAGVVAVFFGLVAGAWRLATRRPEGSLLPARVLREQTGAIVVECPSCDETIVVPQVASDVSMPPNSQAWLLPYLARVLKDKLVRRLLTQRSSLLDTQEKAAADVAELEDRLAKIHAPLQERLRAYELRIQELERELALKGEENRELIRAKIQLTKEHMEAAKDWVEFN